ncbi:sugar ABC transporter permease, partial [Campylobacter jejuni]|nr:sugar ABC transporter permease [Campylobacter jejuni]
YQEAFMFFRTNYASAISVIFLLFILILTLLKIKFLDKKD